MRPLHRYLTFLTIVGASLAPARAAAQEPRQPWQDSWHWGVYAGGASLKTAVASISAPTIGGEWFITGSDFALRVFAEQSSFTGASQLTINGMAAARLVSIADLRRVGFSVATFLPALGNIKPYADVGYSLNMLSVANDSVASYASTAQRDSVTSAINSAKTSGKLFGSVGAMLVMGKMAPFAQMTVMPTKGDGKTLLNGNAMAYLFSVGLRYNFGRSQEKGF